MSEDVASLKSALGKAKVEMGEVVKASAEASHSIIIARGSTHRGIYLEPEEYGKLVNRERVAKERRQELQVEIADIRRRLRSIERHNGRTVCDHFTDVASESLDRCEFIKLLGEAKLRAAGEIRVK